MTRIDPQSPRARKTLTLVEGLQRAFADRLEQVAAKAGHPQPFEPVSWLRDGGRHGGGTRLGVGDTPVFDRASLNVSAIHYDDRPDKRLASATALSCIVHPAHPRAPSMHMHYSFTELRAGDGYWRLMADLNPSMPDAADTAAFRAAIQAAAGPHFERGEADGQRYFYIPALERHRGVSHFYLERFTTGDWHADAALTDQVGRAVINAYGDIVDRALARHGAPTADERAAQRAYHTLYFFQVLTLDRGTTSGLLVHDQNDVGILGSLPSTIDRDLLASWRDQVPAPQNALLDGLLAALPDANPTPIDTETKRALAKTVRAHYQQHPAALNLQAAGSIVPPTVANHQ